uniref:Uncharacterized protein n=1 Tax=Elaeophora elaphi TaxID=1147741 RepID=A0A0R3RS80_9BILA
MILLLRCFIKCCNISNALDQIEKVRVEDEFKARALVAALTSNERELLHLALGNFEKQLPLNVSNVLQLLPHKKISLQQTYQFFLVNSIPFISFGFLDNAVMPFESSFVRAVANPGRGIGLIAGCLIRMFSFFFFDPSSSKTKLHETMDKNDTRERFEKRIFRSKLLNPADSMLGLKYNTMKENRCKKDEQRRRKK